MKTMKELIEILKDKQYHKASELVRKLRLRDSRALRKLVREARLSGYPIISDNNGYKLLSRRQTIQIEHYLKPYVSRAHNILKTYYKLCKKTQAEILNEFLDKII